MGLGAAATAAVSGAPALSLSNNSMALSATSTADSCGGASAQRHVRCPWPSHLPLSTRAPPPLPSVGSRCSSSSRRKRNIVVLRSKWVPQEGFWEEPDDGYGSDYEEGKDADGDDETGDEAMEGAESVANSQDDELPNEIELLLSSEEKAILQQNEAPDLSKISTKKWNPFHTLALSVQIPIMDKLLEHGVSIDVVDKDGFTALHKAVMGKKEAVISHLLRKGANPHVRDRDGATPLHYAVQVGAMQTVKLLIKYKVDINAADNEDWTPLHVAMQSRSRDIAKVLLINGADKTRRNKDGKLPLDISLCFGRDFKSYELAKLLKLVPANRDL